MMNYINLVVYINSTSSHDNNWKRTDLFVVIPRCLILQNCKVHERRQKQKRMLMLASELKARLTFDRMSKKRWSKKY